LHHLLGKLIFILTHSLAHSLAHEVQGKRRNKCFYQARGFLLILTPVDNYKDSD